MTEKKHKSGKSTESAIIQSLLDDPTKSISVMSNDINSYRQTIWRWKKKLEEENVIWGYTAVIDERKLNKVIFVVLIKTKPISTGFVDILITRIIGEEIKKMDVRLIDLFLVNGEYDWVMRFSAPDHTVARKYYDTLRRIFEDYLLEKPVMVDLNFCLVAEGKSNPEIKKLYDFVSI